MATNGHSLASRAVIDRRFSGRPITSNVLKFADDTKVFRKVDTDGDKQHLQNDLDKLVKWSEKRQMLLNFRKCKCLHTGHGNLDIKHNMGDTVLGVVLQLQMVIKLLG